MPHAIITGITGQDGLYLAELLLSKGYEVFGLIRGQNNPKWALVEKEVPGAVLFDLRRTSWPWATWMPGGTGVGHLTTSMRW